VKTDDNPGGVPIDVFDGLRQASLADRSQLYCDLADGPSSATTARVQTLVRNVPAIARRCRHNSGLGIRRLMWTSAKVVLAGERRQPVYLLRVGDLDVPAFLFERVVDEAGAGDRLDHRANRLAIDIVDPPRKRSQRVRVRRRRQLVDVFSRLGQQTDVDLLLG
jgi:hypothetical protein